VSSFAGRQPGIAVLPKSRRRLFNLFSPIGLKIPIGCSGSVAGSPTHSTAGIIALAQIHGVQIPTVDLDSVQLEQLASIALCVKANFDPNQPRDAHGRWTDADSSENRVPPSSVPAASPRPGHTIVTPQDGTHVTVQLAADNQRENKMVRDIVVQLRLDRAQRQQLHREISGQGYTYQEILQVAKEIFGK
jgi:hypothetical protein